MDEIDPVKSLFFTCDPYPVITTSSKAEIFSSSVTFKLVCPDMEMF